MRYLQYIHLFVIVNTLNIFVNTVFTNKGYVSAAYQACMLTLAWGYIELWHQLLINTHIHMIVPMGES